MIGILLTKIRLFFRSPWSFVMTTLMSIGFAFILGGTTTNVINVPVYVADEIQDSIVWDMLEESDVYNFKMMTNDEMKQKIANGKAEFGIELHKNDYQVLVGVDSRTIDLVQRTVEEAYMKKQQYEQIYAESKATTIAEKKELREDLQRSQENPPFTIQMENFRGSDAVIVDNTFHSLFGFALFFVIYTIAYNVFHILVEKQDGVWDRIILSPVKKWEMYVANLIYSFLTGYLQVAVVFFVFRYWIGLDFNGKFMESLIFIIPYVFAIVAMSILITGLVKTVQQFNAVIPIIAVSMAMIGGAYWPLEVVESKFMIALSKFDPITYGMEALNGVVVYGYPLGEVLYPISILLLMGVVMTGVGIHLMEKRHV
ncbi:ABC transporter permease [Virgibacillus necropolis]|uniref:Multidrug ABC transporter permease n=1 Tax=Virgibacillus necropolis TaxID=163877 RepID=A0A221MGE0_9BACI|nr:ABC transporter permease [Virgibacillus necropolis]ASN06659.1 multidrug ABC transporter permease [Virgibacillus necropolis]